MMAPWEKWMIQHRMAWLLKLIVILLYPVHLLAYYKEALVDVQYTLRNIEMEKRKLNKQ